MYRIPQDRENINCQTKKKRNVSLASPQKLVYNVYNILVRFKMSGMQRVSSPPLYRIEAQRSGFDSERKKEGADMQLSRLLRKPRKRNAASFFSSVIPNRSPARRVRFGEEEGRSGYAAFAALTQTAEAEWSEFLLTTPGCSAAGSARGLGPRCRRFESCHSDHERNLFCLPGQERFFPAFRANIK